METWLKTIIVTIALLSSSHSSWSDYEKLLQRQEMEDVLLIKELKIQELKYALSNAEECVSLLEEEIYNLKRPKTAKVSRYIKKREAAPWKFDKLVPKYNHIDTRISSKMEAALAAYSGPNVELTSIRRSGTKSKHCTGDAIDISKIYADDLIKWLESDEGSKWIETYNLVVYIENITKYKKHPWYFQNPKATGPHIHIHVK